MPPTMPKNLPGPMLGRHLGRKAPSEHQRRKAIPLRPFITLAARPVPASDDYAAKAQVVLTKMMDNDAEGCCVATALAKAIGLQNAYRPGGSPVVATDAEVSKWYHAVGGPADNGLVMVEAFDYAVKNGFVIAGTRHTIEGYASVDTTDGALLDAAFHWFRGLQIGVALTRQQYMHAGDSDVWDLDGSDVVGGHAVPLTARETGGFTLATWAKQPRVTRRAVQSRQWCDEAYVIITKESFSQEGKDNNEVNWDALAAALDAVKNGGTPDIPDDPNPPSPNPPGPNPPGPNPHEWSHTFEVFGYAMRVYAGYSFPTLTALTRKVDYWKLAQDVWAFGKALEQSDWPTVLSSAVAILADLGIALPMERVRALVNGMQSHAGEYPAGKLPANNPVDKPTEGR